MESSPFRPKKPTLSEKVGNLFKHRTFQIVAVLVLISAIGAGLTLWKNPKPVAKRTHINEMGMEVPDSPAVSNAPHDLDEREMVAILISQRVRTINVSRLMATASSDTDIKKYAQDYVDTYSKEVDQMKKWYKQWYNADYQPEYTAEGEAIPYSGDSTEINHSYTKEMLAKQIGFLHFTDIMIAKSSRQEIKNWASDVKSNSKKNIDQLKDWVKVKFNDSSLDSLPSV